MIELLKDRALLKIHGPDALSFLQKFTTNDIVSNDFSYNYILNNQGRYMFDFFVIKVFSASKDNDHLIIDAPKDRAGDLMLELSKLKFRNQFDIALLENFNVYYAPLSNSDFKNHKANIDDKNILLYKDNRHKNLGYRIYTNDINDINKNATKDQLYNLDKYKYAIIDGHIDMIIEKSIPIEYNADAQEAVSFTKGCYRGQEVISRAKNLGTIRKKVVAAVCLGNLNEKKLAEYFTINDIKQQKIFQKADGSDEPNQVGKVCSIWQDKMIVQIRHEQVKNNIVFLDISGKVIECKLYL